MESWRTLQGHYKDPMDPGEVGAGIIEDLPPGGLVPDSPAPDDEVYMPEIMESWRSMKDEDRSEFLCWINGSLQDRWELGKERYDSHIKGMPLPRSAAETAACRNVYRRQPYEAAFSLFAATLCAHSTRFSSLAEACGDTNAV